MYVIRVVDGARVEAEFSGHVRAEEALRAISQAFALAEAGNLERAICDLRGVERGPEGLAVAAAAAACRMGPNTRVALVIVPARQRLARWFARRAGGPGAIAAFHSMPGAAEWLEMNRPRPRLSSTELRHLRDLAREMAAPRGERAGETRRSGAA
ncbi:MAG: hypothetical protein AMXMBFR80_18190 [Dehalococcoidia bacterium]|jgi:hypothetical protein|nr:hypothetical protein [Tepidiformaceae bacterium]